MKEGIHPKYVVSKIKCVCGNVIETKSTRGDLSIEICSNCHPFYTDKARTVSTAGRVDKFKKKYKMK
ncbi:MAG: 50S ribosomal protein L31 [Leptospiraceae bacterium]|nr:50S ribosomal protein L31 [Leptospiraceae bacterium]MCP5513735.1 50S ribosomal protein L31 [Leptospiraceae bacterium]